MGAQQKHIVRGVLLMMAGLLLSACQFKNQYFADFTGADTLHVTGPRFVVTSIQNTEIDKTLPMDCYYMGGVPVNELTDRDLEVEEAEKRVGDEVCSAEAPRRTTSITAAEMLQSLVSWGKQRSLVQIAGVYPSVGSNGDEVLLSGKVIMPADGKFRRYILLSHYTIGSNKEAPSKSFSLEGVLAKLGYAVIIPDYEGYGITADRIHPYLMMELTAKQVVDMYYAVVAYMKERNVNPKYDDIYLMGYSQGGATTMAVERYLETVEELGAEKVRVRRVFAGGGPYDVQATYDRFVTTDVASYPVAVPLVLQGMIYGAKLNITCEQMMSERMYKNMDAWVNSKAYTTAQINAVIGTHQTRELLSAISMNRTSPEVAELYKAMHENSIISYSWKPKAPVYMMHSIDDDTVPYENAVRAMNKWGDANIQFNFGHYGSHTKACLRFISCVQTLLREEQKEEVGL